MGRALGGARRLLSASGAWQRSTRSACAPCAPHQATHSSVELLSQEVNVPADGSAQEPRSLTRHLQTLRSQERLTLDWCSPFARAEAGNDCVPQSRGQCGQLSHPQLQHQYRGGEREGFVTGALHRRGIAPSTASGHAIQAALITSARAHPAHSAHTQSHHEQQQQQQHVEGHQLRICELLQWASSNSCAIPPQSNRGSFSFLPTALSFQAPLLPAGRTPTRHLMEQTVHSTILPRAAAGVPARTFAKRPKKWHGGERPCHGVVRGRVTVSWSRQGLRLP